MHIIELVSVIILYEETCKSYVSLFPPSSVLEMYRFNYLDCLWSMSVFGPIVLSLSLSLSLSVSLSLSLSLSQDRLLEIKII